MSNNAYLLNTSTPISDPYRLAELRNEPGNDYLEVSCAAYRIPVPWLLCFRATDLQTVEIPMDDDEGDSRILRVQLPCTRVELAKENLQEALPVFVRLANDEALGKEYLDFALKALSVYPLPYLSLNPMEVAFMDDPEPYMETMERAIEGSITDVAELSCLSEGATPYPLDIFYTVPSRDHFDASRIESSIALDIGAGMCWYQSPGSARKERPDFVNAFFAEHPSLRNLTEIIKTLMQAQTGPRDFPRCGLSFISPANSTPLHLQAYIHTMTEDAIAKLRADAAFNTQLNGPLAEQFQAVCEKYGFVWAGYKIGVL